jgi:hypothetical protein
MTVHEILPAPGEQRVRNRETLVTTTLVPSIGTILEPRPAGGARLLNLRLIVLFVCERGLAVRPRALECRWVPLSCGYAPGRIDL